MRENRTCGSEGGEAQSLPYPYRRAPGHHSVLAACEVSGGIGEDGGGGGEVVNG